MYAYNKPWYTITGAGKEIAIRFFRVEKHTTPTRLGWQLLHKPRISDQTTFGDVPNKKRV